MINSICFTYSPALWLIQDPIYTIIAFNKLNNGLKNAKILLQLDLLSIVLLKIAFDLGF